MVEGASVVLVLAVAVDGDVAAGLASGCDGIGAYGRFGRVGLRCAGVRSVVGIVGFGLGRWSG